MEFKAGDRVHVTRFGHKEVDFYATLTDFYFDSYAKTAQLVNCSNASFEGGDVYLPSDEYFGPDKADYYTIVEEKEDLLSYNGGSMTTFGSRDFCLKVDEQLKKAGLSPYTPSNNKEINDKDSVGNKDIARMIVAKDSEAIINSDVRTFNAEQTPGTLIETGQVLGMHDFAHIIQLTIEKMEEMGKDDEDIKDIIWNICASEIGKSFILYDTDIRSHQEPEAGYKRSKGYHQYQRGVGMKLMNDEDGYVRYENLDKELESINIDKSVFSVEMDNDGFIVDVKNIFE